MAETRGNTLHSRRCFLQYWNQKSSVQVNPLLVRRPSPKAVVVSKTLTLSPNTAVRLYARAALRSLCPTTFQYLPYIIREPRLPHPLGSLRAFSLNHVHESDQVRVQVEWDTRSKNLIYHHSQCVTIRMSRWPTVFETELLRTKEFWAHPSDRTALNKRA